jgi:superfamily I DNA and/or RNA helicase
MQLRPKVSNYDLSVEKPRGMNHSLDVSLFERLCDAGIPSTSKQNFQFPRAQLTVQRRMRPQIADLVRIPLYQTLQDHTSVMNYPRVEGIYDSLYWFHHTKYEDGAGPIDLKETSHSNQYEVEMVTQLVAHLSKQDGYKEGDVAVITPYVGQLRKLRDSLANTFTVQLSEKDTEEVAALQESETSDLYVPIEVERQSLTQSVRIATVFVPLVLSNNRWTIFREKRRRSLSSH